ncbi:MAG: winged helix-turn-helix transcriptional regulator [Lachnospiraceae bacterium]|nr:winged helix-turn-helix transcriptional regulator [Lachnospiraceae bacterium]
MIANAVCHRSFLTPGKIQVALFDDRLEVTSPGMLDNEITIEKMKTGLSKIRNKGIAAALSYMNVIEAWGSGIPRMFREAQEYGLKEPELIDLGSDFRVNLYRAKTEVDKYGVLENKNGIGVNETNLETNETNGDTNLDTNRNNTNTELILYLIQLNPKIRQKEIVEKTSISLSTVKRIMAKLQKEGKIRRKGSNRFGEWIIEK